MCYWYGQNIDMIDMNFIWINFSNIHYDFVHALLDDVNENSAPY